MVAVGVGTARFAQGDLADRPDCGERRPQLVRHIAREALHLLERLLEPFQGLVEHDGQAPQLVMRMVDGQAIVQPRGGDRLRAHRHPGDRRQRAAGQRVAAEAGGRHAERQAEDQEQRQLAQLLAHRGVGPRDLDDDGLAAHGLRPAQHAEGRPAIVHGDDLIGRMGGEGRGLRQRVAARHRRLEEELALQRPHLEPRVVFVLHRVGVRRVVGVEPGDAAVGPLLPHLGRPAEIAPQPRVERVGDAAADEHEHAGRVDGEHDHHRGDVPERQARANPERRSPTLHAASSRTTKPTPRTV